MTKPSDVMTRHGLVVREAGDGDLGRVAAVSSAAFPDYPDTEDDLRAGDTRLRAAGFVLVRLLAEVDGEPVATGRFQHMPWQFRSDRYQLAVAVIPRWRRRGVGATVYEHLLARLRARGARELESFARETDADAVAFLEHRGFRRTMRTWEMRLDLRTFDPAPFAPALERVAREGVVLTTLAEERRRDPETLRRIHDLHNAVMTDIPSPIPYTPVSFDLFVQTNVEAPQALPDAYYLARVGDRYVGEANLRRPGHGAHLVHNVTGVLREFRGRGLAMALKLHTIAYGQAHGYAEIRTWNEEQNARMLAINDRLGFVRQPAWLTYERALDPQEGRV